MDENQCVIEAEVFRSSRKELVTLIAAAKEKCWSDIIDSVQSDIWGRPYKMVMKRLGRKKPATGIQIPGRLDDIVHTLFPPAIPGTVPVDTVTATSFPAITVEEVRTAARALPNGKAPRPDGIPNEIVKAAALHDPQRFATYSMPAWQVHTIRLVGRRQNWFCCPSQENRRRILQPIVLSVCSTLLGSC